MRLADRIESSRVIGKLLSLEPETCVGFFIRDLRRTGTRRVMCVLMKAYKTRSGLIIVRLEKGIGAYGGSKETCHILLTPWDCPRALRMGHMEDEGNPRDARRISSERPPKL